VAVYCLARPGRLVEALEQAQIPVTCFGAQGLRDAGVVWQLARALRHQRPALLQTFLFHANLAGRLAGWRAGVPKVISGIRVAEHRTRMHLWLDRITNRLVDRNVCVSQAVADFSIRRAKLDPRKIIVIPNGVDAARFSAASPADLKQYGIPVGSRTFLFVGRLDQQKGLSYLLAAWQRLVATHPALQLLLVGEGPLRPALEAQIVELGLTASVRLLGWREEIPELMRAVDCVVLPSLWEGMPNVVLEAMAAGLPVVATRVEGTQEVIQDGRTGWLISPRSVSELTRALTEVIADPAAAQLRGECGRELVQQQFTWEAMVNRYEQLYRIVLKE
jgi:glycosyltransferase involved in cell wall biosynthesis